MWEQVGKAEVEVRLRPWKEAELREYLMREYGAGTEPGFLLREAAKVARRPAGRVRKALTGVVRALFEAMARRPGGGSAMPTG